MRDPVGEDLGTDLGAVEPYSEKFDFAQWTQSVVFEASWEGKTSLIPSFVRAYIAETGREVVAVPAAKGCTRAEDWLPGTAGYGAIVKKTRAAMKKSGEIGDVFAVWLQGESDMIARTEPEVYADRVAHIKDGLKKDLGIACFGIIRVGRFTSVAVRDAALYKELLRADMGIIAAQDGLCRRDGDFVMLTAIADELITGEKKYVNPNIAGHFSALGLQTLGAAAGKALGRYKSEY